MLWSRQRSDRSVIVDRDAWVASNFRRLCVPGNNVQVGIRCFEMPMEAIGVENEGIPEIAIRSPDFRIRLRRGSCAAVFLTQKARHYHPQRTALTCQALDIRYIHLFIPTVKEHFTILGSLKIAV